MTQETSPSGLRQNKNWRSLWRGQSVSMTGDAIFMVTVMLWIATRLARSSNGQLASWAPAAVSGALIAMALPALVAGPLAGVWVDRWNRRRTMLTADAARFALVASLLALPLAQHQLPVGAQLGILYSVLAAASCFAEFFNPSRLAILGAIVPADDLPKASGQLQAAAAFAQILGPPIAAPLLVTFGVQWALILDAASFGISFLCVRAIRVTQRPAAVAQERASFRAEFRTGIGYFAGNKVLVGQAVSVVILMLGVGAVNAVSVFFVVRNLHASAGWLGAIAALIGAGAVAGSLGAGALARRVSLGRLLWLSMLVGGVALIGLSRCTALPPALAACLLLGISVGVINAIDAPIMLRTTPEHLIGRVSAVFSPLQQISSITAMALAGLLAGTVLARFHTVVAGIHFGPYDTIFGLSGLLFVAAGLALIRPMRALPAAPVAPAGQPAVGESAAATPETAPAT